MLHKKSEKGQALILIVLAILGLIGLTALAVDGGVAYSDRRQAQTAADSAALDAALAKVRGGGWEAEGMARANSNGYDDNGTTNTVVVNSPPAAGCNGTLSPYNTDEYVQVVIRASTETFFGPVVGINEVNNCVEAIARAVPGTTDEMAFGNAVVSLSEHDCKAMKYQGNANTTVLGSGLFVNSDCSDSAFFNNSGSAHLNAPCLQAVGGITYKPGALNIPGDCIKTGAAPLPKITYPNPVCSGSAIQAGNTLSPGSISGTFPPGGVTLLQPGVYCVDGNFRMNAHDTLSGSDVVIVVQTGDVRWNGGATINLDAPNSGPFAGLLIFMPESNSNEIHINGNSTSTFTGSFLAPSAAITVNGTGGASGLNSQLIGYTVDISGTSDMLIIYNDSDNFDAPVAPVIELMR